MKSNFFLNLKWAFFVSKRFSRVDRKGKSAVTTFLASLGIALGVTTLITVLSVMNGFQMSFIDSILEVSSYHARIKVNPQFLDENFENLQENSAKNFFDFSKLEDFFSQNQKVKCAIPFYEAQALAASINGKQSAILIRAVPKDIFEKDLGFAKEMALRAGDFDFSAENSIILGSEVAMNLGAHIGSRINLFAMSGADDVNLLDSERIFTVTGIFRTGYSEINAAYAFVPILVAQKYFGKKSPRFYGVKLLNSNDDAIFLSEFKRCFPQIQAESWREYNRSFFGALKVEKNILTLLVFLIFLVVATNIFNGIRRIVLERRQEISIFSALGAKKSSIRGIFAAQGFLIGIKGVIPGVFFGLLISLKIDFVFLAISKIVYFFQIVGTKIFSPKMLSYVRENPMFAIYAKIGARVFWGEVGFVAIFALFSAIFASYMASKNVLRATVAEVLNENH